MNRAVVASAATIASVTAIGLAATTQPRPEPTCGAPFVRAGARCCDSAEAPGGVCARSTPPAPRWVRVPETTLVLGPSDWEAEGRVAPRVIAVHAFHMDAYEATADEVSGKLTADHARAARGLTLEEARQYCAARGARLPTEDEWIAAAAGERARRYPWGDTGAVCRRAAWDLAGGACAPAGASSEGPDSVGAHPDGRTPSGIEDLAGNVAEWTAIGAGGVAHGGSWRSALATELRTWARLEMAPGARDDRVGVRCARDVASAEGAPGQSSLDSSTP